MGSHTIGAAFVAAVALITASPAPAQQVPVTNRSVTLDPADLGKQVVTVRMTPTETRAYDQLTFDCRLRQEFDWPGPNGSTLRRSVEPVVFTYRRPDVRMVAGLDCYVSFFVPVDVAELRTRYGPTTFATNAAVTVSRVTVSATAEGTSVWSFTESARAGRLPEPGITPAPPSRPANGDAP